VCPVQDKSDADLLRSLELGNTELVAVLYDRHAAFIYRYALRVSGNPSVAEEVAQETFLAMIRQAGQFNPARGLLSTWLCTIARRLVWKHIQNRQRFLPLDSEEIPRQPGSEFEAPDVQFSRSEAVELVRRGIEELPLQMKEVIVLCAFEEMSYEDVAAVLGVPVGTVRSRLHRAKVRLTEILDNAARSTRKENSKL